MEIDIIIEVVCMVSLAILVGCPFGYWLGHKHGVRAAVDEINERFG